MNENPLRIAVLASSSFPVAQPFAGGLEAHVYNLVRALTQRGHQVSLFAADGSSVDLDATLLPVRTLDLSPISIADVAITPTAIREHHAYLAVMLELAGTLSRSFDIVHNHSLHYLPLAMSATLSVPMVTTLHTPPFAWLESAVALAPSGANTFAAVSEFAASQWADVTAGTVVIRNGISLEEWPFGTGGDYVVWSGRVVPEKGLHLAIAAAKEAGRSLRIAGPLSNLEYFHEFVEPMLDENIRYVGHLDQPALAALVAGAEVALVSPVWSEPYGLVVAEALACGTPVAAFARGGIPEIVDASSGVLVAADDVHGLAAAIPAAAALRRPDVRARAEQVCSMDRMVDEYEALYHSTLDAHVEKLDDRLAIA
ncbi:glycosyltransferase family 4 protein [Rhodococcus sp. SBT000017]|uniref:glycosyltransferase n=1 Tax=Rhodococcus sp. SBT000017 TaxID=1803385 RepID=UPI000EF961C2|nr:glycosyltransferase [Rhodococcus sp. SBT000017]RMB76610.1 glycosyltransferase family 4 protein [Rhodococcus sp. SBT000017]